VVLELIIAVTALSLTHQCTLLLLLQPLLPCLTAYTTQHAKANKEGKHRFEMQMDKDFELHSAATAAATAGAAATSPVKPAAAATTNGHTTAATAASGASPTVTVRNTGSIKSLLIKLLYQKH
jgi:hypothetical protein